MRLALSIPVVFLAACSIDKTPEGFVHAQMGGKGVVDYDGATKKFSHVYSNEKSFNKAADDVLALGLGAVAGSASKAKTASDAATTQQAQSQASQLAIQKQTDATALASQAAKDAKQAAARAAGAPALVPAQ